MRPCSSASPLLYASSSQLRLRIGKTEAPSSRNPTLSKRWANDLGRLACAQWARHDFMIRAIRSGTWEFQTTASQSVATNIVLPPGFKRRYASEITRPTSGTYSATCAQTTASKDASGRSILVASPTANDRHFGGFRRSHMPTRSADISMPTTAPSEPTSAAILSHRKPGPEPISSTRSPFIKASCSSISDR